MPTCQRHRTADRQLSNVLRFEPDPAGRSQWMWQPFRIAQIPGKGMGVIAARDICAGERVMSEAPLAQWAVAPNATTAEKIESFARMQATLDPESIKAILALSQDPMHGAEPTLLGTWMTNGLPISYDSGAAGRTKAAAVFNNVCRINHSCGPNCHEEWNAALGMATIHAIHDVPEGAELCISYLENSGDERASRRRKLLDRFGFVCTCERCELTGDALGMSEVRQRTLRTLLAATPCLKIEPLAERLRNLEVLLRIMEQEGLPLVWAWKSQLLLLLEASMHELTLASDESSRDIRRDRALGWATRATESLQTAVGRDHPGCELVATFVQMLQEQARRDDAARSSICATGTTISTTTTERFFELAQQYGQYADT